MLNPDDYSVSIEEYYLHVDPILLRAGKKIKDWYEEALVDEYLAALLDYEIEEGDEVEEEDPYIRVVDGNTYIHPSLILMFGRWVYPRFNRELNNILLGKTPRPDKSTTLKELLFEYESRHYSNLDSGVN